MNAAALFRIADRIARLAPTHNDPERFHIEKSDIVEDLRRIARTLPAARGIE